MVVGFLGEFAEAEAAVGNATGASALRALATRVSDAMNKRLWATARAGGDHFVTQLNKDGSTRDFVDYDANLIAVAHGVAPPRRARKVLARIDAGRCGVGFVSEMYYGERDVTHGNIGDSWCAMARIALFDARARKVVGGRAARAAVDASLRTLQRDLLRGPKAPWMHERYGCDGTQQENRTFGYFEYPSAVAMLLREVRYGIRLGLLEVVVAPFGAPERFEYRVGNVHVDYAPQRVSVEVPGSGSRAHRVEGLAASATYAIGRCDGSSGLAVSDSEGVLRFEAPVGEGCASIAARQGN